MEVAPPSRGEDDIFNLVLKQRSFMAVSFANNDRFEES